jgi:hypothetical protein
MLIMHMAYHEALQKGYVTKRGQKKSLCPADLIPT